MNRIKIFFFTALFVFSISPQVSNAAMQIVPGTKCAKANQTQVFKGKKYTCLKLGKNLYWGNGVLITQPVPTKTASPSPSPTPTPEITYLPSSTSECVSTWNDSTLHLAWTFDATNASNKYVFEFMIQLAIGNVTEKIYTLMNKTSNSQSYELTYDVNSSLFGFFQQKFDSISISAADSLGNVGASCKIIPQGYRNSLPAPIISVTSINHGYMVSWTPSTDTTSNEISIEEYITIDKVSVPTGNFTQVYLSGVNPAVILRSTTEGRWIKARFADKSGSYGPYGAAVYVNPTP